ncbi:ABC transporter permease [Albimonas pacifica]|uniref:Iron(III) transport system permease protein n=1 Tax=Albimonas pacifica TaxID=1114924 RepID=A0A1I3BRE5_9RHOB|nr:iron ABC transporter permease [Albimonas pacifica]SFH64874.1 iron(III) transport system permease protein [Albimonas pacifica]
MTDLTQTVAEGTPRRALRIDWTLALFALLAIALALLVVGPLSRLFIESFSDPETGAFTFGNFVEVATRSRYLVAYGQTLQLAAITVVLSLLLALPMAWAVSRTDMPARGLFHFGVIGAFIMPPFLGAIGWILLAGPNAGWINRIWASATGSTEPLLDIFSVWGLAFIIALNVFPLIFIFATSALDLISSEMEEAAAIHGAGPMRTTWIVTLPLALPAILGATMLVFLETIALYGTPALIAIPARYNVATTQLTTFFEYPARIELAMAFSVPLVLITLVLLIAQRLLLKGGHVSVSGKGGSRQPMRIGRWKWLLLAHGGVVTLLAVVLPAAILISTSFQVAWAKAPTLDNLTLRNYREILFEQETVMSALWNTMSYSLVAATACTALGFAVAYLVIRRLLPGARALAFVAVAPVAVPGIVLAICFYAAYAGPPLSLYGSGALVIVAFVTRFLPISFVSCASGVRSMNPELEEAVLIHGGSRLRALVEVVAPVLKKSLLGVWILVFVICSRELSTAMFLTSYDNRVVSILTLDLSEQGRYENLAAMGVLLLVITSAVVAVGIKLLGRDFMIRKT